MLEISDGIATIVLERPGRGNALSAGFVEALIAACAAGAAAALRAVNDPPGLQARRTRACRCESIQYPARTSSHCIWPTHAIARQSGGGAVSRFAA